MKSNRQRTIDDCKLLYIVYSYNTCNCTSIILNTELIYYISLGIWYDKNWYDFIHNHLIHFEFDLIFSEFESACWEFGLTLCEPGLTTREFELLS